MIIDPADVHRKEMAGAIDTYLDCIDKVNEETGAELAINALFCALMGYALRCEISTTRFDRDLNTVKKEYAKLVNRVDAAAEGGGTA